MPRTPRPTTTRRNALLAVLCLLAAPAVAETLPERAYQDLRWRQLGPFRAGWATAVAGIPGEPGAFLFGGADGGVWKTTDAGATWKPIFAGVGSASIGALAVAPSDPRVLWVGTGQIHQRWDIVSGDGVHRSTDGGATWTHVGLADSRHIGDLWIDPRDARRGDRRRARPRLRPERGARPLPHRGRRRHLGPRPLPRRRHRRLRRRRRSGASRHALRLALAGAPLPLARLLRAGGRAGQRHLQVDRRRPHLAPRRQRRPAHRTARPDRARRGAREPGGARLGGDRRRRPGAGSIARTTAARAGRASTSAPRPRRAT